ncbi:preprotein translocase subunit SecG [soil metagenome]
MDTAINIVMIIVSLVLILVILLQASNSSFQGDASSIHRTRRGVERTLFHLAIGTGVVFVVLAIISSFTD